ncbi:MAG TPA: hypothetical protein VGN89_11060, partial [Phenylobacterium sp.]|nr:hypothetical protein [Phenylobacterium sp.]
MKPIRGRTVLRFEPAIAERIGYFFAEFAVLEWEIDFAIGAVLPHYELAELLSRPRDTAPQKMEVLRRVVGKLAPLSPLAVWLSSDAAEFQSIVSFRNTLAHGLYGGTAPGLIRVTTQDKSRKLELTALSMDEWIERLEVLE